MIKFKKFIRKYFKKLLIPLVALSCLVPIVCLSANAQVNEPSYDIEYNYPDWFLYADCLDLANREYHSGMYGQQARAYSSSNYGLEANHYLFNQRGIMYFPCNARTLALEEPTNTNYYIDLIDYGGTETTLYAFIYYLNNGTVTRCSNFVIINSNAPMLEYHFELTPDNLKNIDFGYVGIGFMSQSGTVLDTYIHIFDEDTIYSLQSIYRKGVNDGSGETAQFSLFELFKHIINYPIDMLRNTFNFELFGINLFDIITFIISLGLVAFIIKLVKH